MTRLVGPLPSLHPALSTTGLLLALQATLLLAMAASVATRTWQDHAWLGFLLVAITVAAWLPEVGHRRARSWWFVYVAGIFLYTLLRSYADETALPVRASYAAETDRILFFGADPGAWLQAHFFEPPALSFLDWAAVLVHWSFFVAPHAMAVAIFLLRRDLFPRYTALIVGTMALGLVAFFAIPTAPPWLASGAGEFPHVFRIMDYVGGEANAGAYDSLYASFGEPNSVAAMPSVHMAVTFALWLWAREHYPRRAPLLLAYNAVMALSLVYLAEHWVVDLVAGMAVAWVCHVAVRLAVSPRATVPGQVQQPVPTRVLEERG